MRIRADPDKKHWYLLKAAKGMALAHQLCNGPLVQRA